MTWDEIILKGNVFINAMYQEFEKCGRNNNYKDNDIRWLLLGADDMVGERGRKCECD